MKSFSKKKHTIQQLIKAQVNLELEMKTVGIDRFNAAQERAIDSQAESETAWNNKIIMESVDMFSKAIEAYLEYYTGRKGKPSPSLNFLRLLEPRRTALVSLRAIFDSMSTKDIHVTSICKKVGHKIEDEVRFSHLEQAAPSYIKTIKESLAKNNTSSYSHKRKVLNHVGDKLTKEGQVQGWKPWNGKECAHLGALLVDIFQEHVTFNESPIIQKETCWIGGTSPRQETKITMTVEALQWIGEFRSNVEALAPAFAPCVIKPRDWTYNEETETQEGGYHVPDVADTLDMIRGKKSQRARNTYEQCPMVYDTLNGLQKTAWSVSTQVLVVAQYAMEHGLPLALPSSYPLQVPASPIPPELAELKGKELFASLTTKEQHAFLLWKEEAAEIATQEIQRKTDLAKIGRILGEARKYNHYEALYYVYSLDFRSRVYSQGSLLTPQGADLQKGLLRFSCGVALGASGYKWLAFQGANVYGNDKVSIEDRVSFIEDMNEEIMAIACDPLSNRGWVKADKPWQFLNWCFEWADLMKWTEEGNEPEEFLSYIPCANDGSCSGIQHYSAILRDPVGGKSVNLVPSDLPSDIYGEVATVLIGKLQSIIEDNQEGAAMAIQWLSIEGGITRNLCKPPVMTTPYGSTQIACMKTTREYLVDLQAKSNKKALAEEVDFKSVHGFGKSLTDALKFLVPLLWDSIGDVVKAARTAMQFIKSISSKLAKMNKHLEWETPTGFIVEQKIWNMKESIIRTQMFGSTRMTLLTPIEGEIDTRKMGTSAAPNFIHSMDASHLISACNMMLNRGIKDIAVIHDSFGTHAGNTELLRECLLESFVTMYTEFSVLEDLLEWNEEQQMVDLEMELPAMMGLDLDIILESVYCFA